jgi:hypothetical protein
MTAFLKIQSKLDKFHPGFCQPGWETTNNKVNRRFAGSELNASAAADGDETER